MAEKDPVLDVLAGMQEIEREHRLDVDGKVHPFFAWTPGTSRFIGKDKESQTWCDSCEKHHHAHFWEDVDEETGKVTIRDGLEFQEELTTSKAFLSAAVTATGSGKTEWLSVLAIAKGNGQHPAFPELKWRVPRTMYFGTEARTIEPIYRRLYKLTPKRLLKRAYWSKGSEGLEFTNGSTLKMMSYDLPREAWQAIELDDLFLDEEPPRHFWDEAMRRMRKEGSQVHMGCTTLKGATFVRDVCQKFPSSLRNAQSGPLSWSGAPMYANPHLPKDYIKRQRDACRDDPELMEIVVEGKPKHLGGRYIFPEAKLEEMLEKATSPEFYYRVGIDGTPKPTEIKHGAWKVWHLPQPGHRYVMAADLSEGGIEGDFTAVPVLDVDTGEITALFHGRVEPGPFAVELAHMGTWYNKATVNFEKNMQGAAVLDRLREMMYPRVAMSQNFSGKVRTDLQSYGFRTDRNSKPTIISALRDAISEGLIQIPDVGILNELQNFGWLRKEDSGSRRFGMGALSGHDDLVMALAITWFTARSAPPPKKTEFQTKLLWQRIMEGRGKKRPLGTRLEGGICT